MTLANAGERITEIGAAAGTVLAIVALGWALLGLLGGRRPARLVPALLVVTIGAVLSFVAYVEFALRCPTVGCRAARRSVLGSIDPWSGRMHAWQWGAELALASAGLLVASLALALAVRGWRGARPALWGAHGLYATWIAIAVVMPALS